MENAKKYAKITLCIAIILMLISMIVVSVIQTGGGQITIKELKVETDDGIALDANLYIPSTAKPDHKAPAIVTSHGAYNNKEMQDANFVELSRRGYVVLAIDQAGHGDSDLAGTNGISTPSNGGVYEGVVILSRLPYVDKTKIGVTGHSMGGMSCNNAVFMDDKLKTNLISAVLLNCADANYTDQPTIGFGPPAGKIGNIYGKRDVGILSAQFDEFFNTSKDANGQSLSSPYFMPTVNAQSFLHFGTDTQGQDVRNADTMYRQAIDGKDTVRVIYRPAIIHPWSHFSTVSTFDTIDFFQATLPPPNPIPATDQIWTVKEAFNFIGMIGFVLFIISFAILMLFTQYFSSLRSKEVAQPRPADTKAKLWFWGTLIAGSVFSMLVYLPLVTLGNGSAVKQPEVFGIGLWAAACGGFAFLCSFLFYRLYAKKRGYDLAENGVKMSWVKFGKTALLAIIVASISYMWVFAADYFFHTDFRIWTLAFKAFNANLLGISIFPYLILFLIYYIANSMATNCFNYNTIGKKTWVNNLIVSLMAGVPAIILLSIQYGTYFNANHMAFPMGGAGNPPMFILWLFPMLLILPVTTAVSRIIYRASRNPYLAGIISAIIITLFACMNTRTSF